MPPQTNMYKIAILECQHMLLAAGNTGKIFGMEDISLSFRYFYSYFRLDDLSVF